MPKTIQGNLEAKGNRFAIVISRFNSFISERLLAGALDIVEAAFKTQGGLIRIIARLREGRIDDVTISGDFTLLPSFALGALKQSLRGVSATPENLKSKIEEAYYRLNIQSPGVTPADFTTAIMNCGRSSAACVGKQKNL